MVKLLMLAIALVVTTGCGEQTERREAAEEVSVQRCIDAGGFPIRSTWDGRLANCQFIPVTPK